MTLYLPSPQIVEQVNNKLPACFVEKLLAPDSQLLKLRFHREKEVCVCVCTSVCDPTGTGTPPGTGTRSMTSTWLWGERSRHTCVSPQVTSAVHGVYQALLSLKNIPTLEAAYKLVLGEICCALSSLTGALEPGGPSIQHPAFASLTLPQEKAQFTLIFNLSTLTTIGNTKNSLIGVSLMSLSLW